MKHLNPSAWLLAMALMTGGLHVAAYSEAPRTLAAEAAAQNGYPRETLPSRLQRIGRQYRADINFDSSRMGGVMVAAATAASLEKDLDRALSTTAYSYRKSGDKLVTVYLNPAKRRTAAPVRSSNNAPQAPRRQSAGRGSLKGTVLDATGQPVIGAAITIGGTRLGAASAVDGSFAIAGVPAGTYTVEVSCLSYVKLRVQDVKVQPGKATPLDVVMQEDTHQLQGVTVTATYNKASANGLYARQKSMVALSDGISADMIKKTSDNNVAQVLKRISGVTLDNGKYVNVRGMGERYNNVELNGASMPSTEPNRRNFNFDIIPSALVDNVTINKTFTPDLPGEFTGGLVQVNTLAVPDRSFVNLSVGTGVNTASTGKTFLGTRRYTADYFFGEVDKRKWFEGFGDQDKVDATRNNLNHMNSFGLVKYKNMPLQNYSLVAGLPLNLGGGHKLGAVVGLTYRNEQSIDRVLQGSKMLSADSLTRDAHIYNFTTSLGAVANVGWQWNGQKITWRNLYNSRVSLQSLEREKWLDYNNFNVAEVYSTPSINHLMQTQLEGDHKLFGEALHLTWDASYNKLNRTNPDDRLAQGRVNGKLPNGQEIIDWNYGVGFSFYNTSSGHAMYNNMSENKKDIGVNLEHPFIVAGNKQVVKAGYRATFRRSNYEQLYVTATTKDLPKPTGRPANDYSLQGLHSFYDPVWFDSGYIKWSVNDYALRGDSYKGKQNIQAGYLMGDFSFFKKLHIIAGYRAEDATTEVATTIYDRDKQQLVDTVATVKKTDWLPSATVIFNATDNFNLRAAYSRTIARPDFRELTSSHYYNVIDGVDVYGLGQLGQSHTDNYDLRAEWYPAQGEVVSLSFFYKKVTDLIEMLARLSSSHTSYNLYPFNSPETNIYGAELNLRKSLGFIAPGTEALRQLYVSGNFSWLRGTVSDKATDVTRQMGITLHERPMTGLAPYTVNAGLMWQGAQFGAAINYGRTGRKLVMVGEREALDQYEKPRNVLDVQLSGRFLNERLEVKLNASDLLHEDYVKYMNSKKTLERAPGSLDYDPYDWTLQRIKRGVNITLSVGYKF